MQKSVQQMSLLEPEQPPQVLTGAALEQAMRQVFKRWSRWHPAKQFEVAVADPVTRRCLELAVNRAAACKRGPD